METFAQDLIQNIFRQFLSMWRFWLTLGAILGIVLFVKVLIPNEIKNLQNALKFKKGEKWRSDRDLLNWLRGMDPNEFEEYVADLFRRLGYKTRKVGGPNDGGIDVVAEKDGIKHYIQSKKYFAKREVSVGEVRDFYGALADRLSKGKGYFITTNKFTLQAEKFAEDKPIELVDSERLLGYIRLAGKNKDSDYTNLKKCPKCDGKLIIRKGKYGKFYGCSNYPKCEYTAKV